jgi:hypothetical protein
MSFVTALAVMVLTLAGFAQAGAIGMECSHKAKKGTLITTMATTIGGVTLEPGEYEVKQVNSKKGRVVRFTRYTYNPYTQEAVSPHEWETVAEVKITLRAADSVAARTELLVDSNTNQPIGLQVRGNNYDYLFAMA